MRYPEITALYKYRKCDDEGYWLSSLRDRKVWYCKRASLNDPFDSTIMIRTDLTDEQYAAGVENQARKLGFSKAEIPKIVEKKVPLKAETMKNSSRKVQRGIDSMGIYCLTELPDNILMWSHYADEHRGFCIEYKRNPDNHLGQYDVTRNMIYADYPKLYPCDFYDPNTDQPEGILRDDDPYMRMLYTKAPDWGYEKEWRIKNAQPDTLEDWPAEIKSIIFGMEMSDDNKAKIMKILGDSVSYKQAIRRDYEFKLDIIDGGNSRST